MRILLFLSMLLLASCTERSTTSQPTLVPKGSQAIASASENKPPVIVIDASSKVQARLVKRYAATYDYDALLAEPVLKTKLKALLGSEYERFSENMAELRYPIDVISGDLSVVGSKDRGEWDEAILCVRFHPLKVQVGFSAGSQMTVYAHESEYRFLSECLHNWVFMRTSDKRAISMPPVSAKPGEGEFVFQYKVVPQP
jgi:hypothetical protein